MTYIIHVYIYIYHIYMYMYSVAVEKKRNMIIDNLPVR